MRVVLEKLLAEGDIARIHALIAREAFVDGQSSSTLIGKNNLQLPAESAASQAAGSLVVQRLVADETFQLAAQPRFIHPPLFSRYEIGMEYPEHVDNAIMGGRRADLAVTVFLSDRDAYEGGDLVVDTGNGERGYRLDAGCAVVYPASTLHRVAPVTRGARLAAILWVQSMVRDPAQREILYDLGSTLRGLEETAYSARLRRSYWNLVRLWAEV